MKKETSEIFFKNFSFAGENLKPSFITAQDRAALVAGKKEEGLATVQVPYWHAIITSSLNSL